LGFRERREKREERREKQNKPKVTNKNVMACILGTSGIYWRTRKGKPVHKIYEYFSIIFS